MKSQRLSVATIPTRLRIAEIPAAEIIILKKTTRLASDAVHRDTAPVISRLRRRMHVPKQAELERLFHKLPQLDDQSRAEIERFADRLVNKMLHPLQESLHDASKNGTPTGLLNSLRRLFMVED